MNGGRFKKNRPKVRECKKENNKFLERNDFSMLNFIFY